MRSFDVKQPKLVLAFLISVSIFGLLLSNFFVYYTSLEDAFAYRNLMIGSAFGAVCVWGIFVALFPDSRHAIAQFWKGKRHSRPNSTLHGTTFRAHHPSCDNYSTHILSIGNKKFCATCYGLIVGAIFALFGTSLYFFGGVCTGDPSILVLIGGAAVSLGLLQSAFPEFSCGLTRFLASNLFVVGAFLMLISIDGAVKNTSVDLFFIALNILWIQTKINLSQRDHIRICSNCSTESCGNNKKWIR